MSTNRSSDPWEARVQAAAQQFRYPPTPSIHQVIRVKQRPPRALSYVRRGAWALAAQCEP